MLPLLELRVFSLAHQMDFSYQYLRQNENWLKTAPFSRLFSCPKMAKFQIGEGIVILTAIPFWCEIIFFCVSIN